METENNHNTGVELTDLKAAYDAGRVRHFTPYCVRYNEYTLDIEVLTSKADNSGDTWRKQSVKKDGETLWCKSLDDVLSVLANEGLADAYKLRFNHDGSINW